LQCHQNGEEIMDEEDRGSNRGCGLMSRGAFPSLPCDKHLGCPPESQFTHCEEKK